MTNPEKYEDLGTLLREGRIKPTHVPKSYRGLKPGDLAMADLETLADVIFFLQSKVEVGWSWEYATKPPNLEFDVRLLEERTEAKRLQFFLSPKGFITGARYPFTRGFFYQTGVKYLPDAYGASW